MTIKEKKFPFKNISIGLIVFGVILTFTGIIQSNKESQNQIHKQENLIGEIESHFTKAAKQTQEKEILTAKKTEILTSFNKILSKKSNLWNFVFYMKTNDYKTIYISGVAKNEEAKQQLLSLLSQIPNLHVIYEDIKIKDDYKWNFSENEFPTFNKAEDIINPNVKIIEYSEDNLVNGNNNEAFIKAQYEKDEQALKELDKILFEDPLIYKEITDIKTNVLEKVAEVSGILSSTEHKDRVKKILEDLKARDVIFSYADNTIVKDNSKNYIEQENQNHIEYLNQLISNIEKSGFLSNNVNTELKKFHESLLEHKKSAEQQIKDNEKIKELENLSNNELFEDIDKDIGDLEEHIVSEKEVSKQK